MRIDGLIIISVIFLLPTLTYAQDPYDIKLDNFVNDYADILSESEEELLSYDLEYYYNNAIAQIAIVTVDDLDGHDIEGFSYIVAQGNIGDKEKDNGLLILVSVSDRKYRFEVGRGLEPYLNDAKVGRIGRDHLVPSFAEGNYYKGLDDSVYMIGQALGGVDGEESPQNWEGWEVLGAIALMMIILIMVGYLRGMSGSGKRRSGDESFIAAMIASSMFGRGGRGGFGGGFGGFGGGSFGGGGAGGSW